MFGWTTKYVKKTKAKLTVVMVDKKIKVIRPESSALPYEPFLPFIQLQEPIKPIKQIYKRKIFYHQIGGDGYYIKKYSYRITNKHFAFMRGFIWCISPAQRYLQKMMFLRDKGASVVEPLMAVVRRYNAVKQESLLIMREYDGILLKEYLNSVKDIDRRLHVLGQTFSLLSIMHANNIHHGDLTTRNFLVNKNDKVAAFDLDERKTKWLGKLGNNKELSKWTKRCTKMAVEGIENRDKQGKQDIADTLLSYYFSSVHDSNTDKRVHRLNRKK